MWKTQKDRGSVFKLLVIVGESASGKSVIEKQLKDYGFNFITTYTTRPMRIREVNGVDYHFISKEEFEDRVKNNFFAEYTIYRDWYYGSAKEDYKSNSVIVTNPHGLRQIKKTLGKDKITSFYIKTLERERLIRMISRGDDTLECFRRIFSDQGVFQNIERDVDYVVDNNDFKGLERIIKILNLK